MRTDLKNFIGVGQLALVHSAKGSTWEEHKYIKRLNGTYYYPNDYEGGRHLPSGSEGESESKEESLNDAGSTLSSDDIEKLAREVIRGNFGNGQVRKELLGGYYKQIQDRVNEIYRGKTGSTKVSEVSEKEVETGKEMIEKVIENIPASTNGLDYERIFSVYRKK